jgi:Cys-rich protein (TIGR01571 family)
MTDFMCSSVVQGDEAAPVLIKDVQDQPANKPPMGILDKGVCNNSVDTDFSTGLFACWKGDQACQIFLVSSLLPCLAHGIIGDANSEGLGQKYPCMAYTASGIITALGSMCLPGFQVIDASSVFGFLARSKLRRKYGLKERNCADCCTHLFCHPCGMAQELRHIRDERSAMATGGLQDATSQANPTAWSVSKPFKGKRPDFAAAMTASYL